MHLTASEQLTHVAQGSTTGEKIKCCQWQPATEVTCSYEGLQYVL
jgi:hypothetical protein